MSATILDVAVLANVSKATVSRAFSSPDKVNPDTRKRIMEAARRLQYQPNALARAMITKQSGNFAFIIYGEQAPVITNPFYGEILESVVNTTVEMNRSMFIVSDDKIRTEAASLVLQKQVDGIIFASQPNSEMLLRSSEKGIPHVLINHMTDLTESYSLLCDDYGGMKQAVDHLAELGHRRIGFLNGYFTEFIKQRRYQGFVQAMAQNNLRFDPDIAATGGISVQEAIESTKSLLLRENPPTAVICANDTIAVGAMKAVSRMGLRVPEDFSVIGFDDSSFCTMSEPELTSIRIDKQRMGQLAVECLVAQIEKRDWLYPTITMETNIIVRDSTAPCKQ